MLTVTPGSRPETPSPWFCVATAPTSRTAAASLSARRREDGWKLGSVSLL